MSQSLCFVSLSFFVTPHMLLKYLIVDTLISPGRKKVGDEVILRLASCICKCLPEVEVNNDKDENASKASSIAFLHTEYQTEGESSRGVFSAAISSSQMPRLAATQLRGCICSKWISESIWDATRRCRSPSVTICINTFSCKDCVALLPCSAQKLIV